MAEPQMLEGRGEEIIQRNGAQLAGRTVRIFVAPDDE
jgi:hypothetical protein